jgi:hypothetical protein
MAIGELTLGPAWAAQVLQTLPMGSSSETFEA